jgi:hypothetical protein
LGEFFGILRYAQDDGKNEQRQMQRQQQMRGFFASLRMTAETGNGNADSKGKGNRKGNANSKGKGNRKGNANSKGNGKGEGNNKGKGNRKGNANSKGNGKGEGNNKGEGNSNCYQRRRELQDQ